MKLHFDELMESLSLVKIGCSPNSRLWHLASAMEEEIVGLKQPLPATRLEELTSVAQKAYERATPDGYRYSREGLRAAVAAVLSAL